uniref:Uncharacterized protein n=1 Tax=Calcidiscus leptoporus TaxID=127549 RepID=A0A6U5DGE1_9EUKA
MEGTHTCKSVGAHTSRPVVTKLTKPSPLLSDQHRAELPCLQPLTVRRSMPPRAPCSEEAKARLLARSALKPAQRFDSADYFLSKWQESQRVVEARTALAERRIAQSSKQRRPVDTAASPNNPLQSPQPLAFAGRRSVPPPASNSGEAVNRLMASKTITPLKRFDSADFFLEKWQQSKREEGGRATARDRRGRADSHASQLEHLNDGPSAAVRQRSN